MTFLWWLDPFKIQWRVLNSILLQKKLVISEFLLLIDEILIIRKCVPVWCIYFVIFYFQTSSLPEYLLELSKLDKFLLHKNASTDEIFKLELLLTNNSAEWQTKYHKKFRLACDEEPCTFCQENYTYYGFRSIESSYSSGKNYHKNS